MLPELDGEVDTLGEVLVELNADDLMGTSDELDTDKLVDILDVDVDAKDKRDVLAVAEMKKRRNERF